MKISKFKELLSHSLFEADTLRIDAEILDPCGYGKRFELEIDQDMTNIEIGSSVNYCHKAGAKEIIVRWI